MASRKRSGKNKTGKNKTGKNKTGRKQARRKRAGSHEPNAHVTFAPNSGRIVITKNEKVTHAIADCLGGGPKRATVDVLKEPAANRHGTIVDIGCP
jgi:hypothetical protein